MIFNIRELEHLIETSALHVTGDHIKEIYLAPQKKFTCARHTFATTVTLTNGVTFLNQKDHHRIFLRRFEWPLIAFILELLTNSSKKIDKYG
jgi:DNA-binding NtrC family response regulator